MKKIRDKNGRFFKGNIGFWKGKKRPEMIGNKFTKPQHGTDNIFSKISYPAEHHPRWKGGTWLFWRRKALLRDNFTCQKCNLNEPEVMQVDHIVPKKVLKRIGAKNVNELNNLQTLCANCHIKKTNQEKRDGAKGKSYYTKYA